ncbi:cation diffusion facilitator family transporter [Pontibacter sp. 13R65]|uniref:cation diffusion facilitator family transporter n=1 Tax=Pontibacter sp. 13R65 TaxID=3127458 RepID=UPI00301CD7AE
MFKGLSESIRFQMLVVTVGGVLLVTKFVAFFLTNSNAILTDALESIINVVAGLFSLYSLVISARPKDENHPYGHGKIEFIASSVEGSLIMVAGGFIIAKSVVNLFQPVALQQLDYGMLLITGSGIVNYATGYLAEQKGRNSNSVVLVAGGRHLKTDAYSTAGILVGLLLIYLTKQMWLDSVVAILFGGFICYTGLKITRSSVAGIMDEADYELLKRIVEVLNANRRNNWIDIHNLRVIKYGAKLHIDCHLTVPWYLTVLEAHDEVDALSKLVRENIDPGIELFIHTDPCVELSCTVCEKHNCTSRRVDFRQRVEWEFDKVIADKKHGLQ